MFHHTLVLFINATINLNTSSIHLTQTTEIQNPKITIFFFLFYCLASSVSTSLDVGIYELKKGNFSVKFTHWGASIISVNVPDKNGKVGDVVLGFQSVDTYKNDSVYFGAIVGRIANRIAKAQFTLDGKLYKLLANEKGNMLHGGPKGFSHVIWKVKKDKSRGSHPHIVFYYHSTDGEEGFPGALDVTVTYALVANNKLSVKMKAKAVNKATPVNLAATHLLESWRPQ